MSSSATQSADRHDIHQIITDQIVAAIEAGAGEFHMPWHRKHGSLMRPINITTGKPYQGVNVLTLWISAETRGYTAPIWGTFKQWLEKGHPVRKGEKACPGVFYKDLHVSETDANTGAAVDKKIGMARAFSLFNAAQVDGYTPPAEADFTPSVIDSIAHAETLMTSCGVTIKEEGDAAFYRPSTDEVILPPRGQFKDTPSRSATEAFYAVGLHELTHATGAKHRLDRDLSGRFGNAKYAMEELVAELGSAYLCAELGVSPIARPDHAQYITTWLEALRSDKKAIFTAASAAQKAATYLMATLPAPLTPTRPAAVVQPGAASTTEDPQ